MKSLYLNTTCCPAHTPALKKRSFIKLGMSFRLLQVQGQAGVVPPEECLLKAHFMAVMLFPDQNWTWTSERIGTEPPGCLRASVFVCLQGSHHHRWFACGVTHIKHPLLSQRCPNSWISPQSPGMEEICMLNSHFLLKKKGKLQSSLQCAFCTLQSWRWLQLTFKGKGLKQSGS